MGQVVFTILSTVAALYVAYLIAFCIYKKGYGGEERVVFPRIVYFLAFGVSFVPLLNLFCVVMFLAWSVIWSEDYRINSWLFNKPKRKEEEEQ